MVVSLFCPKVVGLLDGNARGAGKRAVLGLHIAWERGSTEQGSLPRHGSINRHLC
jgi:hypothetical protein